MEFKPQSGDLNTPLEGKWTGENKKEMIEENEPSS